MPSISAASGTETTNRSWWSTSATSILLRSPQRLAAESAVRDGTTIMRFGIPGHLPGEVPDPGSRGEKLAIGNGKPFPVRRISFPACTSTLNANLNDTAQRLNGNLNAPTLVGDGGRRISDISAVQDLPAALARARRAATPQGPAAPGAKSPTSVWSCVYWSTLNLAANWAVN